jgi:hypothetical protein
MHVPRFPAVLAHAELCACEVWSLCNRIALYWFLVLPGRLDSGGHADDYLFGVYDDDNLLFVGAAGKSGNASPGDGY